MNGRAPLAESKKLRRRPHAAGLEKRAALLVMQGFSEAFCAWRDFPGPRPVTTTSWMPAPRWTAARIARGEAIAFPPQVPVDAKGLRMAIFA